MLTLFPSLLDYQFFAITLLRVTAALALLYVSYRYVGEREELSRARDLPIIGSVPGWMTICGGFVVFATGLLLFVGLYTQAAAIVGMIVALKDVVFARRYPKLMPLSAGTAALLFVICLSLLLSGAGALAFDLPL